MSDLLPVSFIEELNDSAADYVRSGMSIDDAIQQAVIDHLPLLRGRGYRILSVEEIERSNASRFFVAYP